MLRIHRIVQTGVMRLSQHLLQEILGLVLEDGIQSEMMKMTVLISSMMIEVDEIFHVVVGTDVLYVLLLSGDGHAYYLVVAGGYVRLDWGAVLLEEEIEDGMNKKLVGKQHYCITGFFKILSW